MTKACDSSEWNRRLAWQMKGERDQAVAAAGDAVLKVVSSCQPPRPQVGAFAGVT